MIIKRWIQGSARTQAYGPGAVDASRAERIMLVDATLALSVQSALGMECEYLGELGSTVHAYCLFIVVLANP